MHSKELCVGYILPIHNAIKNIFIEYEKTLHSDNIFC